MRDYCEDYGCRSYNGICTYCNEDFYIEEQILSTEEEE